VRAFIVKVDTRQGRQEVEVRATSQSDAARRALWRFVGEAEVYSVDRKRKQQEVQA
jgi:hypothetical protein